MNGSRVNLVVSLLGLLIAAVFLAMVIVTQHRIQGLNDRVTPIRGSFDGINERLKRIDDRLKEMDKKIDTLGERVKQMETVGDR